MTMKVLEVGILSRKAYIKRTIAIAKGEYQPQANEPKIWFESLTAFDKILNENQALLNLILEKKPSSLNELARVSGHDSHHLSRILKMLAQYGIVTLEKHHNALKPIVNGERFQIECDLHSSFS